MRNKKTTFLTHASLIGAMYVALTFIANLFGLANGAIQIRLSEALTVLPLFTPASVPGLFVGCILSNLLTGCAPWDIVFGSLATLLGAIGTRRIGMLSQRSKRYFGFLPPILANTLIIPLVLRFVYASEESLPFLFLTVGIGEVVSCGVLGYVLLRILEKYAIQLF